MSETHQHGARSDPGCRICHHPGRKGEERYGREITAGIYHACWTRAAIVIIAVMVVLSFVVWFEIF